MMFIRRRALAKSRRKEIVPASKLVEALLNKIGYRQDFYAVFDVWDRLLGRQASKARAVGIQGDKLCVEVDSHVHMHDITLRKRSLLKKVNGHFGTIPLISDIILRLAQTPEGRKKSHK